MKMDATTGGLRACTCACVLLLSAVILAPQGAAAQSTACRLAAATLEPCNGYVSGANMSSPAGSACCAPLASFLKDQPDCICDLSKLDPSINLTRAVVVVQLCALQLPAAASQCLSGTISPSPSPSSAPSPSSKNAPTPSPNTSSPIEGDSGPVASPTNGMGPPSGDGKALSKSLYVSMIVSFICVIYFL